MPTEPGTWNSFVGIVTDGGVTWTQAQGFSYATAALAFAASKAACDAMQNQITLSLTGLLPSGFIEIDVSYPLLSQPKVRLRSSHIVALWPQISENFPG